MSTPKNRWNPTPPERGSFPLDHFGECKDQMEKYLKCLKLVKGDNAPNCRVLAKNYLGCRMNNQLMDQSDWLLLGLPENDKGVPVSRLLDEAAQTAHK